MVKGEQSGIADSAVIEACGKLGPIFASEWSFEGFGVDEELLVGR